MAGENRIDSFSGDFEFLSNFYPSEIEWRGKKWTTVEHAYQAAKTNDTEEQEKIRLSKTPGSAKKLGRKVSLVDDWHAIKIAIMHDLLKLKFAKGSELADRLLATDNAFLIEGNNWGDKIWGQVNGEGSNYLGKLLMLHRDSLKW